MKRIERKFVLEKWWTTGAGGYGLEYERLPVEVAGGGAYFGCPLGRLRGLLAIIIIIIYTISKDSGGRFRGNIRPLFQLSFSPYLL